MVYEFSDLALDLDRHVLTRNGEPVKLTKLSFKALQALVQAAPALISHDELIDRIGAQTGLLHSIIFPRG